MHQYRMTPLAIYFALLFTFLAIPTRSIAAEFVSLSGWLRFSHPDNWEFQQFGNTRTRYTENVMLQPKGQRFNARPGEIVVKVFDPLFVLEEARISPYSDHERVFRAFVEGQPNEKDLVFTRERIDNRETFVARSNSEGVATAYYGQVGANGYLLAVGVAGTSATSQVPDRVVRDLLNTARIGLAPGIRLEPAKAVASWYDAVSRGDSKTLLSLSCQQARVLSGLVGLVLESQQASGVMDAIISSGRLFDYSGLRFWTIQSTDTAAAVRIAGTVKGPDGRLVPFNAYARTFGSTVLTARYEAGQWRVCEPVYAERR
jgi:hypothetical protein